MQLIEKVPAIIWDTFLMWTNMSSMEWDKKHKEDEASKIKKNNNFLFFMQAFSRVTDKFQLSNIVLKHHLKI